MRVLALAAWLAFGVVPALPSGTARAQEPAADVATQADPDTGERHRLERPAEALRRGAWPVPAWVVVTGGAVLAVAAAGVLAWRALRRRR